jgi:hypothetical protein
VLEWLAIKQSYLLTRCGPRSRLRWWELIDFFSKTLKTKCPFLFRYSRCLTVKTHSCTCEMILGLKMDKNLVEISRLCIFSLLSHRESASCENVFFESSQTGKIFCIMFNNNCCVSFLNVLIIVKTIKKCTLVLIISNVGV